MKLAYDVFPSQFAITMAYRVGLLSSTKLNFLREGRDDKLIAEEERLIQFQQMALNSDFDLCLVAYYSVDLDDKQINALREIHKYTPSLLLGITLNQLLTRVENEKSQLRPNQKVIFESLRSALFILRTDHHEKYLHH